MKNINWLLALIMIPFIIIGLYGTYLYYFPSDSIKEINVMYTGYGISGSIYVFFIIQAIFGIIKGFMEKK